MADKVVFELNYEGVGELLRSSEMRNVMSIYAGQVLGRLPSGYGMSLGSTEQRAKATVFTRSRSALKDTLENNTLLKALNGGSQ